MSYSIHNDDVTRWAKEYQGSKFHALLCDPPYHLTSIVKRFGQRNAAPAKGDVYNRASRGFMGQQWDGGDVAFQPETWEALGEHLHPGAFGMAFASTRGSHRMACAIEDAGFIIHPTVYLWAFLSGFPKATRIDTQVDKAAGVEVSRGAAHPAFAPRKADYRTDEFAGNGHTDGIKHQAETDLAQAWAGHRYGLQALKPAVEPIICFQKPYEGRPVDNITQTGAGAWNIDGGRIGVNPGKTTNGKARNIYGDLSYVGGEEWEGNELGRWPSNLILHHHPDCNGVCVDGCAVKALDEQSNGTYDDSGPASRMFYRADWSYEVAEQLANGDILRYEPKASGAEREAGLDSLPTQTRHRVNSGGLENEARFAPTQVKNNHPTVKSISLTKYLATLLLPPAVYAPRRLMVPFCGVGSEMIGGILGGWDEVKGIEMTADYLSIADARLAWWSQWPGWGQTDVDKILEAGQLKPNGQMEMF